jgi:hypothetical protein
MRSSAAPLFEEVPKVFGGLTRFFLKKNNAIKAA